MRRKSDFLLMLLLAGVDSGMIALAFVAAYYLRVNTEYPPPVQMPSLRTYVPMMWIQVITLVLTFGAYRLYFLKRGVSRVDELYTVFVGVSVGTVMATAATSFIFKDLDYPRLMVVYAWALTIIFVGLWRLLYGQINAVLRARGIGRARLLIVGAGRVGAMILQAVRRSPQLGYQPIGFIDNDSAIKNVEGVPVLGNIDCLGDSIHDNKVDEVIIALPHASHEEVLSIVSLCDGRTVDVKVFPDLFQIMASEVSIGDLNGLPLMSIRDVSLRGWRLTLKRAVDVFFSALVMVFLSPFLLLTSLIIRIDSEGPVFYSQERVGLDGKPFPCIKFRTMRVDAESDTGPVWATKDDPRRTRIGGFLRRFSIDEIPQFINVLLGHMSVVGPRPERPLFVQQFAHDVPRYMERHREKAGITGWAQVNGLRGDTSIEERTRYDLWYIENWSLLLDFKIMFKTALAMLRGDNAY
jgi:exopolysaccharide biosynthesis polyprenyl glycosylphosphotransferase